MLDNVLKVRWINTTIQIILFIALSTGSYLASQYVTNLNKDSIVLGSLSGSILFFGGVACVWVSLSMDNKYFSLHSISEETGDV